jgi:hypothetical protein
MAVFVLPIQHGSHVFDARQYQYNRRSRPPGNEHELQDFDEYDAETHKQVMLSDSVEFVVIHCEDGSAKRK